MAIGNYACDGKRKMNTWVTSDIHFGHKNIIRYCNRPFKNVIEMDSHIIDTWNRRVGTDDAVYFLGDFAMGPGVDDGFIADKLNMLHGHIHAIVGNHDEPNPRFGQSGLAKIVEDFNLQHKVTILPSVHETRIDGQLFVMCHYPMKVWHWKEQGVPHLHGHIHTQFTPTRLQRMFSENRFDVGVDMFGGPVQLTGDLRFLRGAKGWK